MLKAEIFSIALMSTLIVGSQAVAQSNIGDVKSRCQENWKRSLQISTRWRRVSHGHRYATCWRHCLSQAI